MQKQRTGIAAPPPEHDAAGGALPVAVAQKGTPVPADDPDFALAAPAAGPQGHSGGTARRTVVLAVAGFAAAVLALAAVSLCVGAGEVGASGVLNYLLDRGGARSDPRLALVVGDLRLPRTLTELIV
ncbi:Fe(3+)-hydroxamate ABC transporter permease FhuB, partial [Streptomyces rimosus]